MAEDGPCGTGQTGTAGAEGDQCPCPAEGPAPSRAMPHREGGQNLSAGFPSWISEVVPVKPLNNAPNVSFHLMGKSIYGG